MEKLILVNQEQTHFHLTNGRISYLLEIEDYGLVAQVYFGQAIREYHGQRKYPRIDRGFSGNLPGCLERGYSPDTLPRDYSFSGDGDYRTPAFIGYHADGSRLTHLTFSKYDIMNGKPKLVGLPQAYVLDETEAQTLILTLEDSVSQLVVQLFYTIYRDRDVVTRSVKVLNHGQSAIELHKVASLQLDLPSADYELLSFHGAHVNERQLQGESIAYGCKRLASRRGTTSHHMTNSIMLATPQTTENQGEVYGFNLVYSGNFAIDIERGQVNQLRITIGINDENFNWLLSPSETFQSPEAVMTFSNQGLNGMSRTFHQLIRERIVRGVHQYRERPILVNNWEATYFDFTESSLRPIVDEAAALGIEMFVLDDGWFGQRDDDTTSLGDWQVNARKFPNGLKAFADYVHEKGLQFGLWVEPEMISFASKLYQTHPDYVLALPNREPSPSRSQYVLDLSRDEVQENVYQQLKSLLDEGFIDYLKWDMNRHLSDVFSYALPKERQGEVAHRYTLGLYALLERLTTEYPNILFEGCSGGGGRLDTGLAYYMPQSWTSDNTDAVDRLKIQYGTSYIYPPATFTSHVSAVPNHQTGRTTSLEMRGNVAMSSVFGYELDLTTLTESEKLSVKQQVATYKTIRRLVQFGDFIRLASPFDGNTCAWEFVTPDRSECLVFTFQVLSSAQPTISLIKLAGLDPKREYQNLATNEIVGGDELMSLGFYQVSRQEDFVSWRYHFKAID